MKYRKIGRTGLEVSEIAYGSWITLSNQLDLKHTKKMIDLAFEQGINYIDTADVYARGEAENLLGKILDSYNRRHFIVATKAFWPMSDHPTDKGLTRKHLIDSICGSLERLKLEYVDIFYCHRFDTETPLEESLRTLEDLICQGKIIYWGTSEWTAAQISEAVQICRSRGWHPPVINQPNYSLAVREIEKEILPVTANLGMGTACFSPLAQGILTGKYSHGKIPSDSRGSDDRLGMFMKESLADSNLLEKVDSLKPIAENRGCTLAQLALAWILRKKEISSVIVGATKPEQLISNITASEITLSADEAARINSIFPASKVE